MKTKILKNNLLFIIPLIILLIISLLNIYGASFISTLYAKSYIKQSIWLSISIIILVLTYKINLSFLLNKSIYFYILGIISLILVLFLGKNINGATSWLKIGFISFQPSELFKMFYIIYLAKVISDSKDTNSILFLKIIILTFIPCILIFLEPDTGVVIMYLLMMLGLLLESDIKPSYIIILFLVALLMIVLFFYLYFFKSDIFIDYFGTSFFYRIDRLLDFSNNTSYQLNNALVGMGASGTSGLGLTNKKIYIPEVTTDFAFALLICNFGYPIGIFVTILYILLLYFIYKEKTKIKDKTSKLILSSIFYMMFFQVGEHILMNLGLVPITGITLPFLSYGGSSLVSYFMLVGLILKVTTNNSSYN